MGELNDLLTKLENAEYRLSSSKSEVFKTGIEWIGHKNDQNGIRPLQDKLLAIKARETAKPKATIIIPRSNPIPVQIH